MKAEEFDRYVRSQFQGETATPPASVEEAVFASVAAESKGRRPAWPAAAFLIVAAAGAALWYNAPDPVPTETVRPVQAAPAKAVDVEQDVTPLPLEERIVPSEALASEEVEAPRDAASAEALSTSDQPESLEPVGTREVGVLNTEAGSDSAELQRKDEETWVMPAVVKVND